MAGARVWSLLLGIVLQEAVAAQPHACSIDSDVVIWGGTVCGVTATSAVVRTDPSLRVLWLVNGSRLGGMTSGGLGGRDGGKSILGGLAAELYKPLGQNFEPHVAETTIEQFLKNNSAPGNVTVKRNTGWILEVDSVGEKPRRITAVTTMSGFRACGRVFIDCSYEGDLLRLSNTSFAVGRESMSEFNESMAGADGPSYDAYAEKPSFFASDVSPFTDSTNTTLLPTIVAVYNETQGQADDWIQSYCFRMCLSCDKSKAIPIESPDGYDARYLELMRREIQSATKLGLKLQLRSLFLVRQLPNQKIDLNSGQWNTKGGSGGFFPFSTDLPFAQHDWPLGNASVRTRVFEEHKWWTKAMLYYLSTDAELRRIQPSLVNEVSSYGLCGDEYPDSPDHWTPQLYVRESIRLRGERFFTQKDVCSPSHAPSSVGLSKWQPDIHAVKRFAAKINGKWRVVNAGGRDSGRAAVASCAYNVEIPYEVLVPRKEDTSNLLVPVCPSMTHVAFASYRLEPQYAIFGHATGTAAALALQDSLEEPVVQTVEIGALQALLKKQGQKLYAGPSPSPSPFPPQAKIFDCQLGRCIGNKFGGPYKNASCDSACATLGKDEWLANTCCSIWNSDGGLLTALEDTVLKKSTADSWNLPASMKLAVPKGSKCRMSESGHMFQGYALCTPETLEQGRSEILKLV